MSDLTTPHITQELVEEALKEIQENVRAALKKHGTATHPTIHSILGDFTEEYHELITAIQSNDPIKIKAEILDLGCASVWGLISLKAINHELKSRCATAC